MVFQYLHDTSSKWKESRGYEANIIRSNYDSMLHWQPLWVCRGKRLGAAPFFVVINWIARVRSTVLDRHLLAHEPYQIFHQYERQMMWEPLTWISNGRSIEEDSLWLFSERHERMFYWSTRIICRTTFTLSLIENFLFERSVLAEAVAGLVRCSRLVVGNLRHRAAG